jgi:hypothetical protein
MPQGALYVSVTVQVPPLLQLYLFSLTSSRCFEGPVLNVKQYTHPALTIRLLVCFGFLQLPAHWAWATPPGASTSNALIRTRIRKRLVCFTLQAPLLKGSSYRLRLPLNSFPGYSAHNPLVAYVALKSADEPLRAIRPQPEGRGPPIGALRIEKH